MRKCASFSLAPLAAALLVVILTASPALASPATGLASSQTIAGGGYHTLALKTDGSLWAWGQNVYGQLGTGNTTDLYLPTRVGAETDWKSIAAGAAHTLALKSDGSLWAWGANDRGQLGTGNTTDLSTPTRVGTGNDWRSISAGAAHTLALKADGSLWAWGANDRGQLGTGNTTDLSTPTRVGTGSDWQSVAAGASHTLALKTDGSLWTWGHNHDGQLGTGATTDLSFPTRVGTGNDWQSVACGGYHSLALKADGTLWACGLNSEGQLGIGSTLGRTTLTRVGAGNDWRSIAGGYVHSLALQGDGSLWSWGDGWYSQLGLPDNRKRSTPTRIGPATDWQNIASGAYHTVALTTDGSLWTWGWNYYGQLGAGDDPYLSGPALVLQAVRVPTFFQTFTGSDRYETSAMISKRAYPNGAPVVCLVKGDDFPDALAAAPLAAAYGGPVVITPSGWLPPTVLAEMKRLKPSRVFFIGLPVSMRPQVQVALPGAEIVTIVGINRYHTAVLLAEEIRTKLGTVEKVVLAAGDTFPDALSVAPLAAKNGWAILLTPRAGPLPKVTADEVTALGATKALRVGTYVKLPAQVTSVVSLAGTDRYQTSALIAAYATSAGLSFAHVALATGENYPDALVVAPYLVTDGGILLLTQPTTLPTRIRDVLVANAADIRILDFVGLGPAIRPVVKGIVP